MIILCLFPTVPDVSGSSLRSQILPVLFSRVSGLVPPPIAVRRTRPDKGQACRAWGLTPDKAPLPALQR